jgi:hypothetical protein
MKPRPFLRVSVKHFVAQTTVSVVVPVLGMHATYHGVCWTWHRNLGLAWLDKTSLPSENCLSASTLHAHNTYTVISKSNPVLTVWRCTLQRRYAGFVHLLKTHTDGSPRLILNHLQMAIQVARHPGFSLLCKCSFQSIPLTLALFTDTKRQKSDLKVLNWGWRYQKNTCSACMRPWVQAPTPPKSAQ